MDLRNKVLKFADEFDMLPEVGVVLCCVSGGADSMCLLSLLLEISAERGFSVAAAHYNHKLRGAESDRDEDFVRGFAQSLDVPFYTESFDVRAYAYDNKLGIEEAARELRYGFFEKAAANIGACKIATAHTADDNTETMIMNLTRGAGTLGLSGIPPVRGIIIRPMLQITRDEVISRGVPYVDDSTNDLDIHTRNKIRSAVMPVLRGINPRFAQSASAAAEILREDEKYLSSVADAVIMEHCCGCSMSAAKLAELPFAISARVVRKLHGGNLTSGHVKSVLRLCGNDVKPSAEISLPGMTVFRDYAHIVFGRDHSENSLPKMSCKYVVYDDRIKFNKSFTSFLFKCDDLCGKIIVRSRESGDTIKLTGGTKSLKKLFIERRVPRHLRECVPIVADSAGVLAVYGIGVGCRAVPEYGDKAVQIDFEWRVGHSEG